VVGFVLAAGEGRRLRPASLERPKATMPFCGVPLLELAVSRLAGLGLRRIVVNCCHLGDHVEALLAGLASRYPATTLTCSREPRLLDTGGGLREGLRLVPEARHVLVHNVDTLLDYDLAGLVADHLASGALATLALVPGRGPRTVCLRADGTIEDFRRPRGTAPYTFAGVHIFARQALAFLPPRPVCSVIEAYEGALAAGGVVRGVSVGEAYWADLGTTRDYLAAHQSAPCAPFHGHPLLRRAFSAQRRRRARWTAQGCALTGAVGLGHGVKLASGVRLHDAVLWDGVCVEAPALLAAGILTGGRVSGVPAAGVGRRPDPRIFATLGVAADEVRIAPLGPQGSGRCYCRLSHGERSWIWSAYGHERSENAAFAACAGFLKELGLQVPDVLVHLPEKGELLLSDLGSRPLLKVSDPAELRRLLGEVLTQAARLHATGLAALGGLEAVLQKGFTPGLYQWERNYFRENVLQGLLGHAEWWDEGVEGECQAAEALLTSLPPALIHRDLQSANVMVCEGRAWLIDFQGMRRGVGAYDLASLLFDPYRCYGGALRDDAWSAYCQALAGHGVAVPPVEALAAAAVQRLMQALGAYGRLWRHDGLRWYADYLIPGLGMLAEAVAGRGEFRRLRRLVEERCLPAARAVVPRLLEEEAAGPRPG